MTAAMEVAVTTSPETLAASDPDAGVRVAALYETHGRTIVGLCRFLLRDATEAEDAAQQAFLSAYRSLLGGAVPREPAAWLAAIARNECWQRIKRRMREPLALHEVPAPQSDPLEVAARNADFAALRAGLEALSHPQREAFMLREFAGLSYSELALALGVTEPAVDSLLFRARTSLRRALSAANGILVPVALREQLARLIPGFDQPAAGTIARLASLPIAAKLAAAGAGAVLVVAGSTELRGHAPVTTDAATAIASPIIRRAPRSAPASTPRVRSLPHSAGVAELQALQPATRPATRSPGRFASQVFRGPSIHNWSDDPTPADSGTDPVLASPAPGHVSPPPVGGGGGGGGLLPTESTPDDVPTPVATTPVTTALGSDDGAPSHDSSSAGAGEDSSVSGWTRSADSSVTETPEPPAPPEAPEAPAPTTTTPGD
jgi:RNA polymerase sigma-70 factor (ECF subfamily)